MNKNAVYLLMLLVVVATMSVLWSVSVVVERTSTLRFCAATCHEMDTVALEYAQSKHYRNNSGVRATCADCHIPSGGVAKYLRKAGALHELYHTALGTIATDEQFEDRRLILAQRVWDYMEETGSRECKKCHPYSAFDHPNPAMEFAGAQDAPCILCHKGVAHNLP